MTTEPVSKLILSLGIPTTISMLITNIYNMADTFFVSQLGNSASGAVGIVFGFMSILQAVGFMFGQGAGSIISRKLGQHDSASASGYASISFFLSLFSGIVISLLSFTFMTPLLRLLGSTETILPYAKTYVFYIILAAPFMMSSFVMNNILRFEGKAFLSMLGLAAGAVMNIIFDPIFMYVLDMGVAGAGLSTALSQAVSFCILLSMFLRGKTQSKLSIKLLKIDIRTWEIVSTGFPSLIRQGLSSISTMLLNHCAGLYGDAAVAAMSIVSRVNFFMFAIGLGLGQGFQPVCGYNYGAGKYSRVKKGFKFTFIVSEITIGVLAVLGLILSSVVIGWFRDDPDVIAIGSVALRFQCVALFFQPMSVMCNMAFQSTGHRTLASVSAMFRSGIFFIPTLLILNRFFGVLGVESAQAIADIMAAVVMLPMMIFFFKRMPEDSKD